MTADGDPNHTVDSSARSTSFEVRTAFPNGVDTIHTGCNISA